MYIYQDVCLCKRCFNSVTDVVLCVEETQQWELAEKHHRHHLLVRALLRHVEEVVERIQILVTGIVP